MVFSAYPYIGRLNSCSGTINEIACINDHFSQLERLCPTIEVDSDNEWRALNK